MKSELVSPTIQKELAEALEGYPELQHTQIDIQYKSMPFTMLAQPEPSSLFSRKSARRYSIFINNSPELTNINYDSLSHEVRVGWFAHELGHIVDYENMNTCELTGLAISYFVPFLRSKVESSADINAIHHGFGESLIKSVEYKLEHSNESYRKIHLSYYLPLAELQRLSWNSHP